ncbi:hypothetical protein AURDEDRAFT_154462 [Auricularia subglabra TFB-10046 SS5]|uniref:F-box domain-containing protein n=1 Tax=Auricularia subglabra (strain TFB-10046 / SS5) TaxID=717982 RepID=J0DA58_AURST|nr:hypothetical protein AURDEDRAFT_154462 [Auricularia subglabra TFB-10046 SS5]
MNSVVASEKDSSKSRAAGSFRHLPEELLLQVWDALPPLERVCASQVCHHWRASALGSPRLWTRLIFLSAPWDAWTTAVWPNTAVRSKWEQLAVRNIFNPAPGSTIVAFFCELLSRSAQMPLDITVIPPEQPADIGEFAAALRDHAHRVSRLHFRYCQSKTFGHFLQDAGGNFPALRTLTVGFNDSKIAIADKPRRAPDSPLPALRQLHFGVDTSLWPWGCADLDLSGVEDLTIVPRNEDNIRHSLSSCPNLSSLSLVMAYWFHGHGDDAFRTELTQIRTICVSKMHDPTDNYVFYLFDDARFLDLTFDCRGRMPWAVGGLPSSCRALEQPVRLTVRLRNYTYEIEAVDPAERRRCIMLDTHTVGVTPPLWNFWLRAQTAASATIDAAAWSFFTTGLPSSYVIPELTLVVRAHPSELQRVSLAPLSGLEKLRIDVLQPRLRFPRGAVPRLIRDTRLRSLSLAADATFEDVELLSTLVDTVIYI